MICSGFASSPFGVPRRFTNHALVTHGWGVFSSLYLRKEIAICPDEFLAARWMRSGGWVVDGGRVVDGWAVVDGWRVVDARAVVDGWAVVDGRAVVDGGWWSMGGRWSMGGGGSEHLGLP